MRNPHGNLICPRNSGEGKYIENHDGTRSGPWGVTCGYWRCTDDRCCMIDGDRDNFPMESRAVPIEA